MGMQALNEDTSVACRSGGSRHWPPVQISWFTPPEAQILPLSTLVPQPDSGSVFGRMKTSRWEEGEYIGSRIGRHDPPSSFKS